MADERAPRGVIGRLGSLGSDAEIGVIVVSAGGPAMVRHNQAHHAIITITTGGRTGLAPRNAPYATGLGGTPIIQVSNEFRHALQAAAGGGETTPH